MTQHLVSLAALILLVSGCGRFIVHSRFFKIKKLLDSLSILLLAGALLLHWFYYIHNMGLNLLLSFPVVTFYESSVLFVLITLLILNCYFAQQAQNNSLFALADCICGTLLLALNFFSVPASPILFLPSLKSYWLIAHVSLSFLAYALFFSAALISCVALFSVDDERKKTIVIDLIGKGLILFTIGGLIFGAIWAEHSWGRFWAWDPKETWAFITWCIYALLTHLAWSKQISSRTLFVLTALAFLSVLFTFVGVSYLFAGLHSYIKVGDLL